MSIPPVTPVTRAAFFPRPKDSRHFSQQQTNTKHKNDKKGDKNKNGSITQQNNKRR